MPVPYNQSSSGFFLSALLLLLLLLLGESSTLIMDKPDANETVGRNLPHNSGIFQLREVGTTVATDVKKIPTAYSSRLKNKTNSQIVWISNRNGNSGAKANVTTTSAKRNLTTVNQVTSTSYDKGGESRRSNAHHQKLYTDYDVPKDDSYKNHDNHQQDKNYGPSGDYEHQTQSYGQEYYPYASYDYEEKYNTITEDHNVNSYEGALTDPWRVGYVPQDVGYYAPPPVSSEAYYSSPPGPVPLSNGHGCYCPSTSTRSYDCESPTNSFLNIASALGRNLWALAQLMATSSLPFIIPLLAIKMVLVPLKILKILKLIKIFLKLFVILPLFMRIVSPALSQINIPNIFQSFQDMFPSSNSHPMHRPHPQPHNNDELDLEAREQANNNGSAAGGSVSSTLGREDYFGNDTLWDLRACPSRVACEMGVYLTGTMHHSFPQNLVNFIARQAGRAEARASSGKSEAEEEDGDEEEEEELVEKNLMQNMAFRAFLIALGKNWTQEQCNIFKCWVLS